MFEDLNKIFDKNESATNEKERCGKIRWYQLSTPYRIIYGISDTY